MRLLLAQHRFAVAEARSLPFVSMRSMAAVRPEGDIGLSWQLAARRDFVVIADFFEFSKFLPHLCAIICGESTLTSNLMKKFLFSALFMAVASASQGAVIAYTWEEGGDVKTEYSGSLNLTGLSYVTAQGRSQYDYLSIQSNRSMFFNLTDYDPYFGASIVATVSGVNNGEVLGTGAWITQTSRFGSQFGYGRRSGGGGAVYVGYQYASGDAIDGGTVAENTTLAAFGITAPSTLVFSWSGDSITHYYGTRPPAVPLPAGLPLIATGLGAFAWLRRRNKTA